MPEGAVARKIEQPEAEKNISDPVLELEILMGKKEGIHRKTGEPLPRWKEMPGSVIYEEDYKNLKTLAEKKQNKMRQAWSSSVLPMIKLINQQDFNDDPEISEEHINIEEAYKAVNNIDSGVRKKAMIQAMISQEKLEEMKERSLRMLIRKLDNLFKRNEMMRRKIAALLEQLTDHQEALDTPRQAEAKQMLRSKITAVDEELLQKIEAELDELHRTMWEIDKERKQEVLDFNEQQKRVLTINAAIRIEINKRTDALLSKMVSDLKRKQEKDQKKAAA